MPPPKRKPFKKSFKKKKNAPPTEEVFRVKTPRGREVFGIIEQRMGGSKLRVRCLDGKNRLCRIPGRMKRRLWVREGDTVVVEPWELGGDVKGDIVYKYRPNQVSWLRKRNLITEIEESDEF
ncbi:translation initiation factor eIF-1A [Candidatus Woesearchaeota archaeon]|jgi:translation initiation factor 1A|nr:translation initiation factor eIF-1A [Candidatus Woesearchaeota archaeon]MBT3438752.1 translation initiation factor eIF-1A [Candidatus Woesearchaeota archaeon]MBT4058449.1 translation initiation factor eIF-1A [Candidatus Woesearchaeota archaeon]MBT4208762.1 translation initiation factor eIF-1A [Candidatus Woesearchaeota archaeon]MBT4733149.1 translation initiation factor eIF-1A [Candidatus Woesearchaeota archaeon]